MVKSATDVMQQIIYGAVVDAITALRDSSRGMPNTLLRDIGAINANATFADLPKSVQNAVRLSTKDAFNQLLKEGYAVGPRTEVRPARAAPKRAPRRRQNPA